MLPANQPSPEGTPVQPALSRLLSRYLQRQAEAHATGLAAVAADAGGEVTPYEVGPVQPIDARPAWEEAIAVAKCYGAGDARAWQAPPQWPQLVAAHEPAAALAFCVGNFPQLMRNFQQLLQARTLAELRPTAGRPVQASALLEWAKKIAAQKQFPGVVLALGALRLANQFAEADELVQACESSVPANWSAAWANEKAALAWQRGHVDEALAQWQAMPASVPVLFNRGMAALFAGQPAEARAALTEAVSQLPETSAWHHLGRLYLTLVETKQ
jgi:tetratricopeptide (TPR) repeat protein